MHPAQALLLRNGAIFMGKEKGFEVHYFFS
jgi:hypothetical protein